MSASYALDHALTKSTVLVRWLLQSSEVMQVTMFNELHMSPDKMCASPDEQGRGLGLLYRKGPSKQTMSVSFSVEKPHQSHRFGLTVLLCPYRGTRHCAIPRWRRYVR